MLMYDQSFYFPCKTCQDTGVSVDLGDMFCTAWETRSPQTVFIALNPVIVDKWAQMTQVDPNFYLL